MMQVLFIIVFFFQQNGSDIRLVLARAAESQVGVTLRYVSAYERLEYPGGDVPMERGVCCDVIVRAFRKIGVDLQKEIYEDKKQNIDAYPNFWSAKIADRNIDHRRVPNLTRYFKRKGKSIALDADYEPGDVVAWLLPSGLYHIGIVSDDVVEGEPRKYMIHNIGSGAKKEDVLENYTIIGHFRW
ncbi:MAG: DUF1287 domain-containing protein [Ignavibacteriales bacterium]|nr:DUF1287 domain-containing protein [Ignavibacteriales bacterium]